MKPYFAKYLPVGKEIKSNKWQWYNNVQNTGWENISPSDMDAIIAHGLQPAPEFRKVKLFLCSRDIQVGDKFIHPNDLMRQFTATEDTITWHPSIGTFKIIGEISKDATWVKEGDEFTADELAVPSHQKDNFHILSTVLTVEQKEPKMTYLVKCPCCGDFK